jgi:hypothetical protein
VIQHEAESLRERHKPILLGRQADLRRNGEPATLEHEAQRFDTAIWCRQVVDTAEDHLPHSRDEDQHFDSPSGDPSSGSTSEISRTSIDVALGDVEVGFADGTGESWLPRPHAPPGGGAEGLRARVSLGQNRHRVTLIASRVEREELRAFVVGLRERSR